MKYLDEIVNIVNNQFGKIIYFDRKEKRFLVYSKNELFRYERSKDPLIKLIMKDLDEKRFVQYIDYDKEFIKYLGLRFVDEHKELYKDKDIGKPFAFTKFKSVTNELGLLDEWLLLIKHDIAFDVYEWSNDKGLFEDECDKDIYQQITNVLCEIRNNNYGQYINSQILFDIKGTYDHLTFHMLSSENVNGISFYFGQKDFEQYKCIAGEHHHLISDLKTLHSLIDCGSFYFENEYDIDSFNPYGEKALLSSILSNPGKIYTNYLPESFGIFILQALKDAKKELDSFISGPYLKDINRSDNFIYRHYSNEPFVELLPIHKMIPEEFFYDVEKDDFYNVNPSKIIKGEWSMSLRRINSYENIENLDERIFVCQYVIFIVDEKSGLIINALLLNGLGRPISNVFKELSNFFANKVIAKNIITNSLLDYMVFSEAFSYLIEKHKIKIDFAPSSLVIDDVIKRFFDQFDNNDNHHFDA